MNNEEFYEVCDKNAKALFSADEKMLEYVKSIAHSLASLADSYDVANDIGTTEEEDND